MGENKKVFFIINKYSGTGYNPDVEGRIITACGKLNMECTIEFTRDRGHATELAQLAIHQGFHAVFAVGGDGTVNEVAQGLVRSNVAMGILPKGSGNGLARHLGVPMNFTKSLSLIGSQNMIMMDTVLVNDQLSVNVAGIGFDGHVAGLFGKNGKRGLLGYGKLVLREFQDYREFEVDLHLDGVLTNRNAFIIALANSSQFGNNARVSPHASVCDELVDICFIKKVPLTQAFGFARRMFSGSIERSPFVTIQKAKELSLSFPVPMAYHIDGEAKEPVSKFVISVQPGSLRMIVPAGAVGR